MLGRSRTAARERAFARGPPADSNTSTAVEKVLETPLALRRGTIAGHTSGEAHRTDQYGTGLCLDPPAHCRNASFLSNAPRPLPRASAMLPSVKPSMCPKNGTKIIIIYTPE